MAPIRTGFVDAKLRLGTAAVFISAFVHVYAPIIYHNVAGDTVTVVASRQILAFSVFLAFHYRTFVYINTLFLTTRQ